MDQRGIKGGDQWRTLSFRETRTWALDASDVDPPEGEVKNASMIVLELPGLEDRTEDVTEGVMNILGQIIVLKRVLDLAPDTNYKVVILYEKAEEHMENVFFLECPALEE